MTLGGTSGTAAASLAVGAGGGWLEVQAPDGRALRFPYLAWARLLRRPEPANRGEDPGHLRPER
jgi:hypothetical protein